MSQRVPRSLVQTAKNSLESLLDLTEVAGSATSCYTPELIQSRLDALASQSGEEADREVAYLKGLKNRLA